LFGGALMSNVLERLDAEVDAFMNSVGFFHEPLTVERAKMFVRQHRLNTRYRNSVLKLAVATNCPDWDLRMKIIHAASEELIADHEFGDGKPHWAILEEQGQYIGMDLDDIRAAQPLPTTQVAWLAWEALMKNRPWLEGLMANTCAERSNIPGYGRGMVRDLGWFGMERIRWGELFGLKDDQLVFFSLHEEADIIHSNLGWQTVARDAERLGQTDAAVEACRINLHVWKTYIDGIAEAADARS
jgi:pyrroloquinoline quinone (PQQ) biosynthesis protein C